MLQTIVLGKKDAVNGTKFIEATEKLTKNKYFAQNLPTLSSFSKLISKVCGLFVDMEDSEIVTNLYGLI